MKHLHLLFGGAATAAATDRGRGPYKESATAVRRREASRIGDLAIEVLSRSTAHRDRKIKREAYREAGIREYWIVDPWMPSIVVHLLSEDRRRYVELCHGGEGDTVRSAVLPGLEVGVSDLLPEDR